MTINDHGLANLQGPSGAQSAPVTEANITMLRYEAAQMNYQAANIRLATARAESVSATRTLAMADAIAVSMAHREGITGGEAQS